MEDQRAGGSFGDKLLKDYTPRQVRRTLAKYDLVPVGVEVGRRRLELFGARDAYELLDRMVEQEARRVQVERFPYWAEVWPAAIGLARWLDEHADGGGEAVELGCGLGLAGMALALKGWRVTATDFVEDALVLAHHNARHNQATHHRVAYLDWRHPVGYPVSVLLAADVAYEKKNHRFLQRTVDLLLQPGGRLFLSDPKRPACRALIEAWIQKGFDHRVETVTVDWKSLQYRIDIHCLHRPG